MNTKEVLRKLKSLLKLLEKHDELYYSSLNQGEVVRNHKIIEKQEKQLCKLFGAVEPYVRRFSKLQCYEPTTGTSHDPWVNALIDELPMRKGTSLRAIIKESHRIIGRLETMEAEEIQLGDTHVLYNSLKLHPDIIRYSKAAFLKGMYAEATLSAYKEIVLKVREISGLREQDGTSLMEHAFSLTNPKIKLNDLKTRSDKDEQAGYLNIFKGVALGIRNPKAHEHIVQKDPYKTLEFLSLASLLLKKLDERKSPK